MELKRVVVTGLGAITPIGNNVPSYWEGLLNGVNGAADITRFDASKFKSRFACEVKNYDYKDYFDRKDVRKYDLFAQFGLIAADEAIADSGLIDGNTDLDEVGVIWSSGIGGLITFSEEVTAFATGDGTPRFNPFLFLK
jgi:3-oxoacyl-[acyl-carrier-protein] synthase II